MSKYYWLCSYPLGAGSIINPGNWGRMVKHYTPQRASNPWLALKEYIFENVRLRNYLDKPSRLESIFLCESLENLQRFKSECNGSRDLDLAFEVEILEEKANIFRTDWQFVNISQAESIKDLEKKADVYWNPQGEIKNPEILTTSKIRVLNQLL